MTDATGSWLKSVLGSISLPQINFVDIIEIIILSVIIYHILRWIKKTKAWILLKGFGVLLIFTAVARFFRMDTIYWIAEKILGFGITALLIVFQPELRKALEELGQRSFFENFSLLDTTKEINELFSDRTLNEIVKATFEMARVRTGALMVIQQNISMAEYERTGISLDSVVSSQLLVNIFEHNTPLHDGAVIINGDRITSATCYLPLSDSMSLSKDLGTRHRAGVGISEVTDSLTIIVSEETGKVSVAYGGELERGLDAQRLRERLSVFQNKTIEQKRFLFRKGKVKDEKQADA